MTPGTPLVAQTVKNLLAMQGNWVCPWVRKIPWNRKWQTTPVFFPGEFHGQRSQAGYSPWGHKESDMIEWLTYTVWHQIINCSEPRGKGNIGCKYTYDNKISMWFLFKCNIFPNLVISLSSIFRLKYVFESKTVSFLEKGKSSSGRSPAFASRNNWLNRHNVIPF